MFNLSKLEFLDKITGDAFTATEVNEIKTKFNLLVDFINANGGSTPIITAATNDLVSGLTVNSNHLVSFELLPGELPSDYEIEVL